MHTAAHVTPTFDELYHRLRSLPQGQTGEILNGDLIVSPRPAVWHANTSGCIDYDLRGPFHRRAGGPKGPGGWWILPEPELHFQLPGETHVLSPDLAGWKRERLPALPDVAFLTLAPDWVCEILSPSTARYDRRGKARVYHQAGVTWRWLVDPKERTLEAYRREGDFWVQLGIWEDEEKVRVEPFDAVELEIGTWWDVESKA